MIVRVRPGTLVPPRAALPLSHGERQTPPKQCPVLPPAGGTGVNVKKEET